MIALTGDVRIVGVLGTLSVFSKHNTETHVEMPVNVANIIVRDSRIKENKNIPVEEPRAGVISCESRRKVSPCRVYAC